MHVVVGCVAQLASQRGAFGHVFWILGEGVEGLRLGRRGGGRVLVLAVILCGGVEMRLGEVDRRGVGSRRESRGCDRL